MDYNRPNIGIDTNRSHRLGCAKVNGMFVTAQKARRSTHKRRQSYLNRVEWCWTAPRLAQNEPSFGFDKEEPQHKFSSGKI